MKIQSLSVVVPAKKCINSCKFCVSKMHESEYENMISSNNLYYDLYKKDFINRLEFARDNGCNTVMLTGDCEPLQNKTFLKEFGNYNQSLKSPFKIIELQTAGNLLTNDYLYFLRHHVGVTTISLSLNSFQNSENSKIIGCGVFSIKDLCESIKKYRFNLRLSLNINKEFDSETPDSLFDKCSNLGADQVTFRKLYMSGFNTPENKWIMNNKARSNFWTEFREFIIDFGSKLEKLEFGLIKHSINNMSVVLDDDCMSTEAKQALKYLILRENCKLYSKWDNKGSLIF